MWVLVELEDTFRLAPDKFAHAEIDGILAEIDKKYASKVRLNMI